MSFEIKALDFFLRQIEGLDEKSKRVIEDKIRLIKENPYRFKRIHSKRFSKVFRVRLNIRGSETRLIYAIIEPAIVLVCLLERRKDYRDLEKYLKSIDD